MTAMDVVIARIGKAHGLRGEVALNISTDQPAERLAVGTVLRAEGREGERELTIASHRTQQGRWYVRFAEVSDRTGAESLRGLALRTEIDTAEEAAEDPDAWYPAELTGLTVRHVDGRELGTVTGLEHYPAQDLLIVRGVDGRRVMLPFVGELVPEVDTEAGVVLADPPGGLFEDLPDEDAGEAAGDAAGAADAGTSDPAGS